MEIKITNNRYCWVYVSKDDNPKMVQIDTWVSPDQSAEPFPMWPTPFEYSLTRNDVRYLVHSEVQLSQNLAIRIAGQLYDSEFIIAPKINMRRRVVNR